jgi:hypothetical protein
LAWPAVLKICPFVKKHIAATKPVNFMAQNRLTAQKWQISASEVALKKCQLLKTLHLAGRESRCLQRFKSTQRGDPYQHFFMLGFPWWVVWPAKSRLFSPDRGAIALL